MPIRNSLLLASAATAVLVPTTAQISVASDLVHEDLPRSWAELANPLPRATDNAKADTKPDIDANKSYAIPALEIIGFDALVNLVNRRHNSDYRSNWPTIRHNLHSSWVVRSGCTCATSSGCVSWLRSMAVAS